uniref:Zinc finger, CCHC-type n=1 Tax=Tanacetum cinerariifolium TaxID=118510 RepID=A0A699HMW2_TANCI|nr:zinc finger, CCHC-type [Tanacetum cinerariifolium]
MNGGNEKVGDIEERSGKRVLGYELPIECNYIIQKRNLNNRDKTTTKSYHRMLGMLERERHDQLERKRDDRWVVMSVVYVLTTPMPESGGDNPTLEQVRKRAKWDNDDYVCRCLIFNDFKHTLKHLKEELTLVELGSHLRIEESLRAQDNDNPKGNNVVGPLVVNMVEHNNSSRTEDSGGLVIPEKVTEEVVQQPKHKHKKSKRHRTPKDFRPEFQLYLIKGIRDEVSDQHSYCFNIEDDPKTFDEAMNTIRLMFDMESIHNLIIHQMDVKTAFLNGELDEEVYMNQPRGFIMPGNENKVDLTKEFLSSRFSLKDMGEANFILVSTSMDTSEKLMPNKGQAISQLEYSRMIGCLMYAMTCTRPDITFDVGKLSK